VDRTATGAVVRRGHRAAGDPAAGPRAGRARGASGGIDIWRQWRGDRDASPGLHRLRVRATDQAGATQTPRRAGPVPNGASGWDSTVVTVT